MSRSSWRSSASSASAPGRSCRSPRRARSSAAIGVAAPRDADAKTVTLRAVPGGYALADRDGTVLYRAEGLDAKRACLHRAAADGALRVVA